MGKVRVQDLMIGDWVSLNGKPIQITEITGGHGAWGASIHYIESTDNWRVVYLERSSEYAHLPTIEPIEVTHELLKKNGFEQDEKYKTEYRIETFNNRITIELVGGYMRLYNALMSYNPEDTAEVVHDSEVHISSVYLHNLQNAFRLLDIDFDWKV